MDELDPAVDRAAYRLSALCRHRTEKAARAALVERGYAWRECREALIPLVRNPTRTEGTARRRRELDAAEPLYKRSLTIREKALGPEHSDVGQIFNNLASLYEAQGRKAGAFSHGFWQVGRF